MGSEGFLESDFDSLAQLLYDAKAFNILVLDVRSISSLANFFIIAEGHSTRHVVSLHRKIIERLKEFGEVPIYVEGVREGEWIVIDYGYLIFHLFIPEFRNFYRLEELWKEGEIVSLDIKISKNEA